MDDAEETYPAFSLEGLKEAIANASAAYRANSRIIIVPPASCDPMGPEGSRPMGWWIGDFCAWQHRIYKMTSTDPIAWEPVSPDEEDDPPVD